MWWLDEERARLGLEIVFTPVKEWGGNKVPGNIEENAVITPHGIEWLHPPQDRPHVIR